MLLVVLLSVSVEIRDGFYLLYYIQSAIARTSSSAGFLDFFFFFLSSVRTMGSKKSFKKADRQMRDRSPFSSNCLVIGSGFHFPTIALAGGEEDRCGLAGTSFLQAGCAVGPGGRSLLAGL